MASACRGMHCMHISLVSYNKGCHSCLKSRMKSQAENIMKIKKKRSIIIGKGIKIIRKSFFAVCDPNDLLLKYQMKTK